MSVQYPKNTHITLPSVEGAFSTLNILRDPPKSIHTRYIEKVGDTNRIIDQIDGASDRTCEAILPFQRGVNPMVNVNYSNVGTNGGQVRYRYGSYTDNQQIQTPQASLPYKVMRDGVFRPAIIPPRELLPLSRLPRLATTQTTNPGSERVLQEIKCKPDLRSIRKELLNVCAPNNATYRIEKPHEQPYDVKNAIQVRPTGMMITNLSSSVKNDIIKDNPSINKEVQNRTYKQVSTNAFKDAPTPIHSSSIGIQPISVKDRINVQQTTNVSTAGTGDLIQGVQRELARNLPQARVYTNAVNPNTNLDNSAMAREYYLPSRTSRGSFCNAGTQTTFHHQVSAQPAQLKQNSVMREAYMLGHGRR